MQNMSWDTACRGIFCTMYRSKRPLPATPTFGLKSFNKYLACGIIAFSISSFLLLSHFFFLSTSLDHLVNQELITVLFAILYGVTFNHLSILDSDTFSHQVRGVSNNQHKKPAKVVSNPILALHWIQEERKRRFNLQPACSPIPPYDIIPLDLSSLYLYFSALIKTEPLLSTTRSYITSVPPFERVRRISQPRQEKHPK